MIKRSKDREANILGHFLPNGRVFANKFTEGSVMRRTLLGFAKTCIDVNSKLASVAFEFFPDSTTDLLPEWEKLVGIPNAYFDGQGDLQTRRNHVAVMLHAQGTQTEQDFIDLAAMLGYTITIEHNAVGEPELLPLDVPFVPAAFIVGPNFVWQCIVQGEPVPDMLVTFFNTLKSAETLIEFSSNP